MKERMAMSMLNKKILIVLLVFLSCMNIFSLKKYSELSGYTKFEYDLADYISNANGIGEVYINTERTDNQVELYFYSSLYKIHYSITFSDRKFSGYAEKFTYIEPYVIDNAERKKIESFEGDIENIEELKFISAKYIQLAYKLLLGSN